MGYERERDYVWSNHGIKVATCHVAHVKAKLGLTTRAAWSWVDPKRRVKPCPEKLWPIVEEAVRHVHNL